MSAPADRYVVSFDGVDDYVSIPARTFSAFTIAADIYINTVANSEVLHFTQQQPAIGISSGVLNGYFHNNSWAAFAVAGNTSLQTETWYHVAVTYNGSNLVVYLNRVQDGIEAVTATIGTDIGGGVSSIGAGSWSPGAGNFDHFHGLIANVRVYNRGLSAGEIEDIENVTSGLVRAYALDEGTGTTAANTGSDGSANGTLVGATWEFIEDDEPPPETDFTPIAPNAVLATDNLQDTLSNSPPTRLADIQDSPDDPDADWWTAIDVTSATEARLGFPPPPAALVGQQKFRLWLRKTAGTPNPTVDVELWEDGSQAATLASGVSITSTSGQLVEATWLPAQLTGDGSDAEVRIVATPGEE